MWLLPTRRRVQNLRRFLSAAREMGCSTPGLVIVNEDELKELETQYDNIRPFLPVGWNIIGVKADTYGQAIRAVWSRVKDLPWVGLVSDDLVPCTAAWDSALIRQLQGWNMVSSNDGWQSTTGDINRDRLHGAIAWSGDLIRAVGWIFPDRLRHIFHDDVFETIGRETGCWQVRAEIMVKHLHEALQGIRGDTMNRESALWKHDEARFKEWLQYEKDAVVGRVKDLMSKYGVKMMKPDFNGVKLLIATPTVTGDYESHYMVALFNTMELMKANGVVCQLAEEKFTADIALARAKLFGAFYRSDCTHMLMIDADMGWDNSAVIRLFCAKKDFISVAGPKKRYPISFAANYTDEKGNPLNLVYDDESGTMEVSEIGAAFCLISRSCADKLVKAYPELGFIGVTGEQEYALFNPLVANNRFFSEDFAFCKRWRAIGGRVFMVPDVRLKHTGKHTFEGSFAEVAQKEQALRQAAE